MARNWPGHTVRIDDELWTRFDNAVQAVRVENPELTGRSMVIRELIRYWLNNETLSIVFPNHEEESA
jgi:metal-responsive CopG/Arc/MetJ family transcriptional regulator